MAVSLRRLFSHPTLALGSTLIWGLVELIALFRSRWSGHATSAADEHAEWG